MPVGECQREFAAAAAEDGIQLSPQAFPWLCEQGHLALPEISEARKILRVIYIGLGGDEAALASGRRTRLGGDLFHEPTGTLIEVDELQHFTSARLTALDQYPPSIPLGFELDRYRIVCRRHRARADGYRAAKGARGFGPSVRTRQRAYYDALRDLATPTMGHPPLVRIDAPLGDGRAAYRAHRERLLKILPLGT